jgi:hypothetical protein
MSDYLRRLARRGRHTEQATSGQQGYARQAELGDDVDFVQEAIEAGLTLADLDFIRGAR